MLISAGPDGILGTADDVTIPINPNSISVTYLDKGIGGPGAEQISFSSLAGTTLTNDLYEITLLEHRHRRRPRHRRQPAGQPGDRRPSPSTSHPWPRTCSSKREPTPPRPPAAREDPYATIGAAMTAATAGDVIAVLPGVYQEQVTMKQFVQAVLGRHRAAPTAPSSRPAPATPSRRSSGPRSRRPPPAGTYATITASGSSELHRPGHRDRRLHDRQPAGHRTRPAERSTRTPSPSTS